MSEADPTIICLPPPDVNPSEDEDSPASSPLLVGKPPSSPRPQPKAGRKVCFGQMVLYDDEDSAITGDEGGASGEATPPTDAEASASSKESSSRDRKSKGSSEAAAGASKPGVKRVGFEQPILPTDPDEQTLPYVAGDRGSNGGSETDSGGQREEESAERGAEPMEAEPTVAYELAGNSDDTDVTVAEEGDGGRGDVEPTVAYQLEDNPEDTAEGSAAEGTTMAGVSTADSEETTDGGGGEGRGNVEPTVPYFLEESKRKEVRRTGPNPRPLERMVGVEVKVKPGQSMKGGRGNLIPNPVTLIWMSRSRQPVMWGSTVGRRLCLAGRVAEEEEEEREAEGGGGAGGGRLEMVVPPSLNPDLQSHPRAPGGAGAGGGFPVMMVSLTPSLDLRIQPKGQGGGGARGRRLAMVPPFLSLDLQIQLKALRGGGGRPRLKGQVELLSWRLLLNQVLVSSLLMPLPQPPWNRVDPLVRSRGSRRAALEEDQEEADRSK